MKRSCTYLLLLTSLWLFSCKIAKLSDAEAKHRLGEYHEAALIYRKVYTKTPSKNRTLKAETAYQMAQCYRRTNQTSRALTAYQNALRFGHPDSLSLLYAAQMAHKSGRYADAAKLYRSFLEKEPRHPWAKMGLAGCDSAVYWRKHPGPFQVKRMDKLNSRRGEFAPMLLAPEYDKLYFTSSRDQALGDTKSAITGMKNNDFFASKRDEKGQWMAPELIEDPINTEFDEGVCSFTGDGNTVYYTYCSHDEQSPRTAQIYRSSRSGAQWNAGQLVEIFKDSLLMAAHPAVSPDGLFLYFVSDAPGGYGGKDLYRMTINTQAIENLGAQINTPGDEMFPFVRDSVTLYFASNGHPGMGGLDLFQAVQDKQGNWKVSNLGYPINSAADDFGITFAGKNNWGFFSSNRNDGRGSDHLYSFEQPSLHLRVEGWVLDKEQYEIPDASVHLVGKDGTLLKTKVKKDGTYSFEVKPGMEYVMMASAKSYLNQKQELRTDSKKEDQVYYVDFSLSSITRPVLIEHIFYDFDQASLRPESVTALEEMVKLLNDNPHITIELAAHTDRKGSSQYNQNLSLRRAQSVVTFLIQSGIDAQRVSPAGYGKEKSKTVTKALHQSYPFLPEGQLLDEEFIQSLPPEEQDIADQINRRTEFQVLRTTFNLY